MPLYEYKCQVCGKVFETIQKFSDAPLTTHAECGGAVERLFSAPAFHLKGSGWYATDYGKGNAGVKPEGKSKKASAKPESGSSSSESSGSDSKSSESKPAATESKPAASTTA